MSYPYALQIEAHRDALTRFLAEHRVAIVKGPTGCGKSTFIPLLLRERRVAIIEPRRIAVTALFNILRSEIPTVGFKMRFSQSVTPETTMMIYTDGMFLRELLKYKNLKDNAAPSSRNGSVSAPSDASDTAQPDKLSEMQLPFDTIIIDEVHERSVRTDILLGLLRRTFSGRLVLMSATLPSNRLEQFFSAQTFTIPGTVHPLNEHFLDTPTADYIAEAYLTIKRIVSEHTSSEAARSPTAPSEPRRDILVFLPGEEDIRDLAGLCRRIPSVAVFQVHAGLSDTEQQRIFQPCTCMRVILATNICESSLTIPSVRYVVDSGLCKLKVFNGVARLGITAASRESAAQRAGRCNRLGPGDCYRLYTQGTLLPRQQPEIRRADLATPLLCLLAQGCNVLAFPFVDAPPARHCASALAFLHAKGCVRVAVAGRPLRSARDVARLLQAIAKKAVPGSALCVASEGSAGESQAKEAEASANEPASEPVNSTGIDYHRLARATALHITPYGMKLLRHPFDVHLANFYEMCLGAGVGYYASLLLALVSQENYNFIAAVAPREKRPGDIEYLCGLLEGYMKSEDRPRFAAEHKAPLKGLETARRIFKSLNKKKGESRSTDLALVGRLFSRAFAHNHAVSTGSGAYKRVAPNNSPATTELPLLDLPDASPEIFIHPSSGFFTRREKHIVFIDVFVTTKAYARVVSPFYKESS